MANENDFTRLLPNDRNSNRLVNLSFFECRREKVRRKFVG